VRHEEFVERVTELRASGRVEDIRVGSNWSPFSVSNSDLEVDIVPALTQPQTVPREARLPAQVSGPHLCAQAFQNA